VSSPAISTLPRTRVATAYIIHSLGVVFPLPTRDVPVNPAAQAGGGSALSWSRCRSPCPPGPRRGAQDRGLPLQTVPLRSDRPGGARRLPRHQECPLLPLRVLRAVAVLPGRGLSAEQAALQPAAAREGREPHTHRDSVTLQQRRSQGTLIQLASG